MPTINSPANPVVPVETVFGQLNRGTSRFQMKNEDLWDVSNVIQREIGTLTKRSGYTQKQSDYTATTSTSTSTSTTTTSTSTS
jgi:hypothetical protein